MNTVDPTRELRGMVSRVVLLTMVFHAYALAGDLPDPAEARASPEWDAKFRQQDGWIGADGAYSVAVSPQRTIWLFSDTWIGKVRDGRRTDATMVNNMVGV